MAKKGKKKKEAPPPPAPESEVELAPPSDAPAVPDGGASFGRWSLVTLPKRSFAVLLHEGGTAVMLPAKYEAFVYARERPSPEMVALQRRLAERLEAKKAKAGPTAKFEEIQALDAEIAEAQGAIDAQPEGLKLSASGVRIQARAAGAGPKAEEAEAHDAAAAAAQAAIAGLPSAQECREAVPEERPLPPPPGWYKAGEYFLRYCAPTAAAMAAAQQDPDVPPMRSPDATAVLEVVPESEVTQKTAFQLTLSASGGCVATVTPGREPHVLAPVPSADLQRLVVLPDIGGGTWQLRALARFQATELLRSMFCGKVAARASLAVRESLAQEATAADNPWARERKTTTLVLDLIPRVPLTCTVSPFQAAWSTCWSRRRRRRTSCAAWRRWPAPR